MVDLRDGICNGRQEGVSVSFVLHRGTETQWNVGVVPSDKSLKIDLINGH